MRVTHVNTYENSGGAARAANRLHKGLRAIGVDSHMLVRFSSSDDASVHLAHLNPMRRMWGGMRSRANRGRVQKATAGVRPFEAVTAARSHCGAEILSAVPAESILQLHWVSHFLDLPTFLPAAAARHPLVWTLHDMNAFTGGCHFDNQCGRFAERCGSCPQMNQASDDDESRRIWMQKSKALEKIRPDRLRIVAPSLWLAGESRRSGLLGRFAAEHIPYGIDTDVFSPREVAASRGALGLPLDRRIALFVAETVDNPRKGMSVLLDALKGAEDLTLVSIGKNPPPDVDGKRRIHLGHFSDDAALAQIYSAADMFLMPSLQDNLPNTVMESLACGTPVVGFAVGGVPDMVENEKTGFLVTTGDVAALRGAMQKCAAMDAAAHHAMRERCREVALTRYRLVQQAQAYAKLYESITEHFRGAGK